ncbi:MAG: phosphatase PAP2 family protein [Ferruginibacter sp.]
MIKKLIAIDQWLFIKINNGNTSPFVDQLMLLLRNPFFWAPFYLFLIVMAIVNFGKKAAWWILGAGATAGITDSISSHIIKPLFARPRPCGDIYFSSHVRLLASYCGGNGSFTSSHATNHFGLAMFFFITLRSFKGNWQYLFFVWAFLICYAQVYVGVHYPSDVVGGAIVGCFIGWLTGNYFNKKAGPLV